jgi:predicted naringenin-chalcone synthase
MFLHSIGTALPEKCYTKRDCWEAFTESEWFQRLDRRAHAVARAVLSRDNGIEERWLAVDTLAEVFIINPDSLHRRFATHAPRLAANAGGSALDGARLAPHSIGAVVVSTCTGYLCPGLSGYVVERLGLLPNTLCFDLVGQGCAGALPNLQLANAMLAGQQCDHVLSICVEVCSAAMYLDNDPGVLISACLFGDGAGAAVLSRARPTDQRSIEWRDSVSLTNPNAREYLRFEQRAGMLRNILTRSVPRLAAEHAAEVLGTARARVGLARDEITTWIMHAGGRDVLNALEEHLILPSHALRYSREALRRFGNLSSAFVYFVLDAAIRDSAPGGWWWISSFGAGFSCHGALLAVE